MKEDVRWIQRLANYEKALDELKEEINIASKRELSKLEKKGIIQSFEIIQELSWKIIKDFLSLTGNNDIYGSRDAFREAFKLGIIQKGQLFMDSIKSRNQASHTYNEDVSDEIYKDIVNRYYYAFEELRESMLKHKKLRGL